MNSIKDYLTQNFFELFKIETFKETLKENFYFENFHFILIRIFKSKIQSL